MPINLISSIIIDYSQRIPLSIFIDFRYNLIFIGFINNYCYWLSVLSIEHLRHLWDFLYCLFKHFAHSCHICCKSEKFKEIIIFSKMLARPRQRTLKRTFVLLREDEPLHVTSTNKLKHLSDSGRVKELVFTYTVTSRHVIVIIVNNFPALLTNGNISREVPLSPNLFLFQPRNYFSTPDCSFAGLLANQSIWHLRAIKIMCEETH